MFGAPLIDDPARYMTVNAVRLDETLYVREGRYRRQRRSTQVVDVQAGQPLDVIDGKDVDTCCAWFARHLPGWCEQVEWATLDLSNSYRTVFDTMLPLAVQVADPFHVVRLGNTAPYERRRRVRNETVGHRGRKDDLLYRARRRLVMAAERLTVDGRERLMGLLAAGNRAREVWFAWNAKEVVRQIYDHTDTELAVAWVAKIARDFTDASMPFEVRRLGRTIAKWAFQIVAWHQSHVSNGPTEAIINLVKRAKRTAFGFRRFEHYRIRALLYAASRTGHSSTNSPHSEIRSAQYDPVGCLKPGSGRWGINRTASVALSVRGRWHDTGYPEYANVREHHELFVAPDGCQVSDLDA